MRCCSESKLEATAVNETISYKGVVTGSQVGLNRCLDLIVSIWCLLTIPLQNEKVNFNEFVVASLDGKDVVPQ